MNIAVIHLRLALESGDPRMALSLARAYIDLGHDVTVYTAEFDARCFPELTRGLSVRVIAPSADLNALATPQGLLCTIRARMRRASLYRHIVARIAVELPDDVDLVHCQNDDSYKIGVLYKKRNPSAKVVWIMHNPPFYHSHKTNPLFNAASIVWAWWEHHVAQKYARGIDLVVTYDEEKESAARELGIPVRRMAIPVDFKRFYAPVKDVSDFRKVMLCGAGGLSSTRRFEDIVSSVAILREKGYDAQARIACKDYWENESYRRAFTEFVEHSGVKSFIELHFDGVEEREFIPFLQKSTIFVFPSDIKIWGMTVFEAMAAGLPVIVSTTTSVVEVLKDGETAIFVPPHSPEAIADSVEKILTDASFVRRVAENGQIFVREQMTWDRYAREVLRA